MTSARLSLLKRSECDCKALWCTFRFGGVVVLFHRTSEQIEMPNVNLISRLLQEGPHLEFRKESQLDVLELPYPDPFMASLWTGSGEGLDIKGFGDRSFAISSGGSF